MRIYVNVFSASEMEFVHLDNFSVPSYFFHHYLTLRENNCSRTATVISAQGCMLHIIYSRYETPGSVH